MIAPALPKQDADTRQAVRGDRNQVIGHVSGGTVIYVSGDYVPPEPKPRTLPIQLAPRSFPLLLGRQSEIKLATDNLPYHQSLEYHGPSGVGKTVLLRHLAHHPAIAPAFPAGLIYLRHRRYQSASDLLQVLYESFYETSVVTKLSDESIRQALAGRQALVLLDESTLPKDQVQRLVEDLPALTFIFAATEHQLWGDGPSIGLVGLSAEASIALIARTLNRPLNEAEETAAASIAGTLKGHPLQLLQAVALAQDEGITLTALAQRLQKPKDLLAFLNKPQRLVLALLAMLAGSALASEQIGEIVRIPAIQPILDLLQRRQLIELTDTGYNALGELTLDEKAAEVLRNRTIDCLTQWVENQGGTLENLDYAEALYRCLEWAVGANRWPAAASIGKALEGAFSLHGQWDAWEQTLQWLLQTAQATGDQVLQGYALHQLGTRALCLNELTIAQTYLEQARDIREAIDDPGLEITQQNLNCLNAPSLSSLPPQNQEKTPFSRKARKRKGLLGGGLAAIVALSSYVAWEAVKPNSEEYSTVSSLERLSEIEFPGSQPFNPAIDTGESDTSSSAEDTGSETGESDPSSSAENISTVTDGAGTSSSAGGTGRSDTSGSTGDSSTVAGESDPSGSTGNPDSGTEGSDPSGFTGNPNSGTEGSDPSGSTENPNSGTGGADPSGSTKNPGPGAGGSEISNIPHQEEECDRLSELYKRGAIAGDQLIRMSVQDEVAWGKTVGVSLALQCPALEGGSTVQLASNDGYLTQNLPASISVPSGTDSFSFEIPADGHNYPNGKEVTITATFDGYSVSLPIEVPPFSEETSPLREVDIPIDPIIDPSLISPPRITIPPEALQQGPF